ADHLIVRLPALFGPGLKKNTLYDLMNDNCVNKINPEGIFQWYPVDRLSDDLARVSSARIHLVNLFTAPIVMRAVIDAFFSGAPVGPAVQPAPVYRLRTKHAEFFGGRDGFIMDTDQVIAALGSYISAARQQHGARL